MNGKPPADRGIREVTKQAKAWLDGRPELEVTLVYSPAIHSFNPKTQTSEIEVRCDIVQMSEELPPSMREVLQSFWSVIEVGEKLVVTL
jgi:hypothetical protein